jgi:phage shock protein A
MPKMKTIETPEPAPAPPLDAAAISERTGRVLDQLESAARNARARVQDVPAELAETIDYVELSMAQQDRFYARQIVAREARRAEEALRALDSALIDARAALVEHEPALRTLAAAVAERRARLEVLGATEDPRETDLARAQLAQGRLRHLLAQVGPFVPVAEDTVARLVRATVTVLRRHRVEQLARELAALRARRDALVEADPHDVDASAVLARLAERVGRPLPVPVLRWPATGDPFAPPVLEAQ